MDSKEGSITRKYVRSLGVQINDSMWNEHQFFHDEYPGLDLGLSIAEGWIAVIDNTTKMLIHAWPKEQVLSVGTIIEWETIE